MSDGSRGKILASGVRRYVDIDLDNDGQIGKTIEDEDRNGIVDGSEKFSYEIYNNGQSITIKSRTEEPTMTILIEIGMSWHKLTTVLQF